MPRSKRSTSGETEKKFLPLNKISCHVKFDENQFSYSINRGNKSSEFLKEITDSSQKSGGDGLETRIELIFLKHLISKIGTNEMISVYTSNDFLTTEFFNYFRDDSRFQGIKILYEEIL